MQDFWNQRYKDNEIVYGYAPNEFLKEFIDNNKPGSMLLPAEGEGRNGIYAAAKGWYVTAFDFSEVAKEKALQLALQKGVQLNYLISTLEDYAATVNNENASVVKNENSSLDKFDAVGLIYVHMPPPLRASFHKKMIDVIKPNGFIVLEGSFLLL